MADKWKQ